MPEVVLLAQLLLDADKVQGGRALREKALDGCARIIRNKDLALRQQPDALAGPQVAPVLPHLVVDFKAARLVRYVKFQGRLLLDGHAHLVALRLGLELAQGILLYLLLAHVLGEIDEHQKLVASTPEGAAQSVHGLSQYNVQKRAEAVRRCTGLTKYFLSYMNLIITSLILSL